jgi:hypothetical protein
MDYLLLKLGWYLAFAFVLGAGIGWFSCSRRQD